MITFFRRTVLFLSILLPLLACLFLATPLIVDHYILPVLLKTTGTMEKHASLSRLTPFSVQGFLRFEENSAPVLSAPFIKAGFSPGGLLKKRFSTVRLDHATFHLHKIEGKYRLQGFSYPETGENPPPAELTPLLLPLAADHLILKECSLLLHENGRPVKRVSLSAELALNFSSAEKQYRLESLSGSFVLFDIVTAFGRIGVSFDDNRIEAELELEADKLPVAALELPESLLVDSGKVKAVVNFGLNPKDMSLEQLEARGSIASLHLVETNIPKADLRIEKDIVFSVSGAPENLEYRIGPVEAVSPVEAKLEVSGTGALIRHGLSTKGELTLQLYSENPLITPPLSITSSYRASLSEKSGFQLEVVADSRRETSISKETLHAVVSPFQVHANLSTAETVSSHITVTAPHAALTVNNEELLFDGGSLSSALTVDQGSTGAELKASFSKIALPSKKLMLKDVDLKIPAVYPFSAAPPPGKKVRLP